MQLILAIDSDPRRSEQLATLVRARLTVDLVQATSAGEGLQALKDRVPDLILTAPLLSPFDDGVLDEYLRDLGAAATHVQTLRIPMLSTGPKKKSAARRLFSLGRKKAPTSSAAPDGCDPKLFADEIAHYLTRSLEDQSASTKAPAGRVPAFEPEPVVAHDDWGAPEALVEEFSMPIAATPTRAPIVETVVEERFVPGEILHLRSAPVIVQPEPPFDGAQGRPAFVETQSVPLIEPEPEAFIEPEAMEFIEPEPMVIAEPERMVEPVAVSAPAPPSAPAPSTPSSGTSASFEAALAAIRAAWVKPEDKKVDAVSPSSAPAPGRPRPLAGSGEVDLTNEIDALEDVAGVDGAVSSDNDDSPDESKPPNARRKVDKPKKRPEKPRGRKVRGPDGRDEWVVFDPNQVEFSALVNKLDEVTDSDEVTTRATTDVR